MVGIHLPHATWGDLAHWCLGNVCISSLERQIAFKKYYLKSDKDIEDAKHIGSLFKENIDMEKINKYKKLLVKGNEIPKAGKG